ncbi:MAG TPA: MIP/aquaporin family protein [Verrucomicrobiales bacterium]|nr:MIP/aquaporin family protein [Verrucomicrobiales bacterium]
MSPYLAEFVGALILILLGNGACANVNLSKSKGQGSGWIVIATGWGLAVAIAVYTVGWISGAHLNPAVTLAMVTLGEISPELAAGYVGAQVAGAFAGAILVWLVYLPHFDATKNPGAILGTFCTGPAIRRPLLNVVSEIAGTFILVLGVLTVLRPENLDPAQGWDAGWGPMLVGLIVFSIGISLGGPTGYAINPARDLGPRIAHWILPIRNKGGSDWSYAWVPVVGPLLGGLLAAWIYGSLWPAAS